MAAIGEFIMEFCLVIATLTLVLSLVHRSSECGHARPLSISMGVGFAVGIVLRCISGGNALLILDTIGFVLACAAAFMSFQIQK